MLRERAAQVTSHDYRCTADLSVVFIVVQGPIPCGYAHLTPRCAFKSTPPICSSAQHFSFRSYFHGLTACAVQGFWHACSSLWSFHPVPIRQARLCDSHELQCQHCGYVPVMYLTVCAATSEYHAARAFDQCKVCNWEFCFLLL